MLKQTITDLLIKRKTKKRANEPAPKSQNGPALKIIK